MNNFKSEININEDINVLMKNYDKDKLKYITKPIINKYEKTRILSERANQINNAMTSLNEVVQQNAANAEQTSANSEELQNQAVRLNNSKVKSLLLISFNTIFLNQLLRPKYSTLTP